MSGKPGVVKCCQSDQSLIPWRLAAPVRERGDHPAAAVGQQAHRGAAVVEQRVAAGRPAGVDVAEVVHLEERLGRHLPVARHDDAAHGDRAQRVAGQLVELVEGRAEPIVQRSRVGVLVDEDPALPDLAADLHEAALGAAQVDEVALVGDLDQLAVGDVVGPRVVLAAQVARRAALVAHHGRAAVLAGVVERADLAVGAAHDEDRQAEVVEGQVVAGAGDVVGPPGHHPHLGPQVRALELEELVAGVPAAGDVGERGEALGWPGAGELPGHLGLQPFLQRSVHVSLLRSFGRSPRRHGWRPGWCRCRWRCRRRARSVPASRRWSASSAFGSW